MRALTNNLTKDRVVAELRKEILYGGYEPGDTLYQERIADELGVSRLPVREAFQILHNEGLITVKPNKVAYVNEISADFLRDHFAVRALMEKEAARLACLNGIDTAPLYEEYMKAEEAIKRSDFSAFDDCNHAIHTMIWEASGNVVLERMISSIWNTMISSEESAAEYAIASNQDHLEIIQALEHKDTELAMALSEAHVRRSYERIKKKIDKNG
ncbi:MAG: GntR family transcriptional regulator [Solobacterium sp.]|nr:GntR family transcriptional regulator [Solobacterium sp.]